MKKADVIDAIVNSVPSVNLKRSDASTIYDSVIEAIRASLVNGETVRLAGIGSLSVTIRRETTYRNPQTTQLIQKPAHKRIKFSMSKVIKEVINLIETVE